MKIFKRKGKQFKRIIKEIGNNFGDIDDEGKLFALLSYYEHLRVPVSRIAELQGCHWQLINYYRKKFGFKKRK